MTRQSTRVVVGALPRKAHEPLIIIGRWSQIITNSCQCSSTTLGHLGGGNHQELPENCSHNDPQVALDAITHANAFRITPNLTMTMNQ